MMGMFGMAQVIGAKSLGVNVLTLFFFFFAPNAVRPSSPVAV